MKTIAVVDYGMGNLRSVAKAMEHVAPRAKVIVSSSAKELSDADRIVFPGQGAANACMASLRSHGLTEVVESAFRNKPFLGICMGLQVLFDHSEENDGIKCLEYVDGNVLKFTPGARSKNDLSAKLKIPHMGWSEVAQAQQHTLWYKIPDRSRFYFVHSYYVQPAEKKIISGRTSYMLDFCSAIAFENVFATQFHPEKSAADGLQLLKNFSEWNPD